MRCNGRSLIAQLKSECSILKYVLITNTVQNYYKLFYSILGTVCPLLTAPDDGMVDCPLGGEGGASEGDSCTVSCDIGFELQGSISRTCQADGIWSGDETTCKEGMNAKFSKIEYNNVGCLLSHMQ